MVVITDDLSPCTLPPEGPSLAMFAAVPERGRVESRGERRRRGRERRGAGVGLEVGDECLAPGVQFREHSSKRVQKERYSASVLKTR